MKSSNKEVPERKTSNSIWKVISKSIYICFIIFQLLLIGHFGLVLLFAVFQQDKSVAINEQWAFAGWFWVTLLLLGICGIIDLILLVFYTVKQHSQGKIKSKSYLAFIVLLSAFVIYIAKMVTLLGKIAPSQFLIGIFIFVTLLLVVLYLGQKSRK